MQNTYAKSEKGFRTLFSMWLCYNRKHLNFIRSTEVNILLKTSERFNCCEVHQRYLEHLLLGCPRKTLANVLLIWMYAFITQKSLNFLWNALAQPSVLNGIHDEQGPSKGTCACAKATTEQALFRAGSNCDRLLIIWGAVILHKYSWL